MKRGKTESARYNFQVSMKEADYFFEPAYNLALCNYKNSDYQEAYKLVKKALSIYPDHIESKELKKTIEDVLSVL